MNSTFTYGTEMTDNSHVDPSDIFYIRKGSGHGVFTLSIPPERLQEVAEAMYILMRTFPFRGKSPVTLDVIVAMAQLMEQDSQFVELLRKVSEGTER